MRQRPVEFDSECELLVRAALRSTRYKSLFFLPWEDLQQEALTIGWEAWRNYDPKKVTGCTFKTYLFSFVRRRIFDLVRVYGDKARTGYSRKEKLLTRNIDKEQDPVDRQLEAKDQARRFFIIAKRLDDRARRWNKGRMIRTRLLRAIYGGQNLCTAAKGLGLSEGRGTQIMWELKKEMEEEKRC